MLQYLLLLAVNFTCYAAQLSPYNDFGNAHQLMDTKSFAQLKEHLPHLTAKEILKSTKKYGPNLFSKAVLGHKNAQSENTKNQYASLINLMRKCGVEKNHKKKQQGFRSTSTHSKK